MNSCRLITTAAWMELFERYDEAKYSQGGDPRSSPRYMHVSAKALQEVTNAGSVIVPKSPPKAA